MTTPDAALLWARAMLEPFPDGTDERKKAAITDMVAVAFEAGHGSRDAEVAANAERVAVLEAKNARLREALRWFLNDSRFVVQVGGNPNVVPAMIEAARAALGDDA
jgi:hypothetical protein